MIPDRYFQVGLTDDAKALVLRYHYSKRWPSNVQFVGTWHQSGGLFGDRGPATAACIFAEPPTRWSQPILELIRLVRVPAEERPLSGLVAATCRALKRRKVIDLVVSYADSTQGHHGGIYQAASWNYEGQRAPACDGVIVGGQFVAGRTCNTRWGTRSPRKLATMLGLTVTPHFDTGKHLYWKPLTRKGRAVARMLGLTQQPYPRPDEYEEPNP